MTRASEGKRAVDREDESLIPEKWKSEKSTSCDSVGQKQIHYWKVRRDTRAAQRAVTELGGRRLIGLFVENQHFYRTWRGRKRTNTKQVCGEDGGGNALFD